MKAISGRINEKTDIELMVPAKNIGIKADITAVKIPIFLLSVSLKAIRKEMKTSDDANMFGRTLATHAAGKNMLKKARI